MKYICKEEAGWAEGETGCWEVMMGVLLETKLPQF
jgi:hypothetical protein